MNYTVNTGNNCCVWCNQWRLIWAHQDHIWMKLIEVLLYTYTISIQAVDYFLSNTQHAPPETSVAILGNKYDAIGHCRSRVISEEKVRQVSFEINIKFVFLALFLDSWLLSMEHCLWRSVPRQDTMWIEWVRCLFNKHATALQYSIHASYFFSIPGLHACGLKFCNYIMLL